MHSPMADILGTMALPLAAFASGCELNDPTLQTITYHYQGLDSHGNLVSLPRTRLSEAIARCVMSELAKDWHPDEDGKMFGVLLAKKDGQYWVLKAFSGLWRGQAMWPGWVPPIPGREKIALAERETLQQLGAIKQELMTLAQSTLAQQVQILTHCFQAQADEINAQLRQRKQARQRDRQALATLNPNEQQAAAAFLIRQSQQDGIAKRHWKQTRDRQLQPLLVALDQENQRRQTLKQERKLLSQRLTQQFHAAYALTNFAGRSASVQSLLAQAPTGTGECCAPKLLHYAASQGFQPLAMAEFWLGQPTEDKQSGEFYGACAERCQPLMGFLLTGLGHIPEKTRYFSEPLLNSSLTTPLTILYEDSELIAIDKPSGLLSVPGRSVNHHPSVLTQLQSQFDGLLRPIHRLDQDTSGILLIAKTLESYRFYQQQFASGRIKKRYEACLSRLLTETQGIIDLPLGPDRQRPYQRVDWQRGKPSLTEYEVLNVTSNQCRVAFYPRTGRTHQLRVHAAHPQGLNAPILGDRLYGQPHGDRLMLHAQRLELPRLNGDQPLIIISPCPF